MNSRWTWIIALALVYAVFFMPWFIERYTDEWNNEIAINGNLAYDLVNGRLQTPFLYPHKVHILGPSVFPFLVAPFYAIFKPYYSLIGLVELMIALASFLIWIVICKKIDIRLVILFGIYAILAPPMFKWQSAYAWATHPESVALQGLIFLLFVSLSQKEFKSNFHILLFGFASGFSVFFLIGNLTMVIAVLLAWAVIERKRFILKLPYFAAGFIVGILPLILRLAFYGGIGEFSAWYLSADNASSPLQTIKLLPSAISKTLIAFAASPMFHVEVKSAVYALIALAGFFALLFKIRANRYLLPIIFYPAIFFLMLSSSKLGEFVGTPTVRYFLPLYPICFFLISYLVMSIYKWSKIIGTILGMLIAAGFFLHEPAYTYHAKRLVNFKSEDFIKLKAYKGYERHMFWALTVPEFVQRTRTSYLDYAKSAHDWELWLVSSELARWTYLESPDKLNEAYNFSKLNGYSDSFTQGLGIGLTEKVLMELVSEHENALPEMSGEKFVKNFESKFESKASDINFDYNSELLMKGKVVGIAGVLAGHNYLPTDILKSHLDRLIDRIILTDSQKIEALVEGYMIPRMSDGSPEPREVECFLNRGCSDLSWIYKRITNEDDYFRAVGKALAYIYALRNFYIPKEIIQDERVKNGMIEGFKRIGFRLGSEKEGYVEIILPEN